MKNSEAIIKLNTIRIMSDVEFSKRIRSDVIAYQSNGKLTELEKVAVVDLKDKAHLLTVIVHSKLPSLLKMIATGIDESDTYSIEVLYSLAQGLFGILMIANTEETSILEFLSAITKSSFRFHSSNEYPTTDARITIENVFRSTDELQDVDVPDVQLSFYVDIDEDYHSMEVLNANKETLFLLCWYENDQREIYLEYPKKET